MGRILALQGGMAVGKTTVARFLAEQGVPVFPEDISRPAARCRADATRDRGFFAHSTRCLLPAKRAWFAAREDVDFLATDGLPAAEVCRRALDWVRRCGAPAPR